MGERPYGAEGGTKLHGRPCMSEPVPLCNPGAPPCGPFVSIGVPGGFSEWWILTWNWLKACCSCGLDPAGQTCGPIGIHLPSAVTTKCWCGWMLGTLGSAKPGPASASSPNEAVAMIESTRIGIFTLYLSFLLKHDLSCENLLPLDRVYNDARLRWPRRFHATGRRRTEGRGAAVL